MLPSKIVLSLVFSAFISQAAIVTAQATSESEAAVTNALTKRVDSFFEFLKAPSVNAEDAFADLLATGPFAGQAEQQKAFVDNYKKLAVSHGRFLVAKPVHFKRVGEDLAFLTFLYETERFPIVWRFAFYRPPLDSTERPDWFVVRLSFDTKLEQLSGLP
ncbi:MAG: hypothetical protein O3C40_25475 [Planctomycetota bacterium]|nr:hypothetical protein [Planctomycetota bacterium]